MFQIMNNPFNANQFRIDKLTKIFNIKHRKMTSIMCDINKILGTISLINEFNRSRIKLESYRVKFELEYDCYIWPCFDMELCCESGEHIIKFTPEMHDRMNIPQVINIKPELDELILFDTTNDANEIEHKWVSLFNKNITEKKRTIDNESVNMLFSNEFLKNKYIIEYDILSIDRKSIDKNIEELTIQRMSKAHDLIRDTYQMLLKMAKLCCYQLLKITDKFTDKDNVQNNITMLSFEMFQWQNQLFDTLIMLNSIAKIYKLDVLRLLLNNIQSLLYVNIYMTNSILKIIHIDSSNESITEDSLNDIINSDQHRLTKYFIDNDQDAFDLNLYRTLDYMENDHTSFNARPYSDILEFEHERMNMEYPKCYNSISNPTFTYNSFYKLLDIAIRIIDFDNETVTQKKLVNRETYYYDLLDYKYITLKLPKNALKKFINYFEIKLNDQHRINMRINDYIDEFNNKLRK